MNRNGNRSKNYTEQETISLFLRDPEVFPYRRSSIQYDGCCKDTHRPYSDILAQYILENKVPLFDPKMLPNEKEQLKMDFRNGHDEVAMESTIARSTKKTEKMLARKWVYEKKEFPIFGTCFEYELNLVANTKRNIDLLSYKDGILYLLELKGSFKDGIYAYPDTLLRAALEISTYGEMLSAHADCFLNRVSLSPMTKRVFHNDQPLQIKEIRKGILISEYGPAFECWKAIKNGDPNYAHVQKFLEQNNIQVCVYDSKDY